MPDTANTPEEQPGQVGQSGPPDSLAPPPGADTPPPASAQQPEPDDQDVTARRRTIAGVVVVIIGLIFLAEQFWGSFWDWGRLWPVVLIALGVYVLLRSRRQ